MHTVDTVQHAKWDPDPAGTVVDDITIPFDEQSPANATEEVNFSRNLNSDSSARGTVLNTQRFLSNADAGSGTLVHELYNSKGESLGMKSADVITLSADFGGGITNATLVLDDTTTIDDLETAMTNFINGGAPGSSATLQADGSVEVIAGAAISNLRLSSDNPLSNGFLSTAFFFPSTMGVGDIENSYTFRVGIV